MTQSTPPSLEMPRGRRPRKTRSSVFWMDFIARWVITLGGLGTIVAVSAVAVFLFVVALPLFLPPKLATRSVQNPSSGEPWAILATDAERLLGVGITVSGNLMTWSQRTGEAVENRSLDWPSPVTAVSQPPGTEDFYLGFADGTVRRGQIKFEETFLEEPSSGDPVADERVDAGTIIKRTGSGQLRRTKLILNVESPLATGSSTAVRSIDHIARKPGTLVATLHDTNDVRLHEVVTKPTASIKSYAVPITPALDQLPAEVRVFGKGNRLLVLSKQGSIGRWDIKSLDQPALVESSPASPADRSIEGADWIVGRETLLIRESNGVLSAGFLTRPSGSTAPTKDGLIWIRAKELSAGEGAIQSATTSAKLRLAATVDEGGVLRIYQITTGQEIASVALGASKVSRLAFAPSDDALLVGSTEGCALIDFSLRHPEATLTSLFRPLWYESYDRPAHVWQSDSAGGAEPKFGMMPLIFGSLKATTYSMLFGAPLALLAAIYTSEFLSKSTKARIKPTIELMAGLPSVVLGFIAAMVLAPLVSQHLMTVLLSFLAIPVTFLLLGHLWQMVPQGVTLRLTSIRFGLICLALPLGAWLAQVIAPWVERTCFAGDLKLWLDGQTGTGLPGWFFLLIPISALVVGWGFVRVVDPILRNRMKEMSRGEAAVWALVRFLVGLAATLGLSALGAFAFQSIGWDPRGSIVDTYIQRNSLVVGFVMGFAIIPIIYTLADDALSTVPEHLRSASLGAGATPWQTATLIVVPAAMSGLFSAVMVGLGRAVGETMIVLMAAGSSPIMDWNVFNGFRTLSANIAIELPEAVQGSTHYRILFFAAVVLFLLTSVLNTIAEVVRMRFRKRAVQL